MNEKCAGEGKEKINIQHHQQHQHPKKMGWLVSGLLRPYGQSLEAPWSVFPHSKENLQITDGVAQRRKGTRGQEN